MPRLKNLVSKFVIVVMILLLTSCYGSFNLTKKLYDWNGSLGDKFVNTLVFYGLLIVPVYEIAGLGDFVIFNTIEFWSGKNPVSMAEGESDTQIVKGDSGEYEITAVKNKFIVKDLASGAVTELVFNHESKTWSVESNGETIQLVKLVEGENDLVELNLPDGKSVTFNPENVTEKSVVLQSVNSAMLSN